MIPWEPIDRAGRVLRCEYQSDAVPANAMAIDLGDGALALVSPPAGAGADEALAALDRRGRVAAIVAPCGYHRAGLAAAEARYPAATIHADPRARARVVKVLRAPDRLLPVDALAERLPVGVELFTPPHLRRPDTIARVQSGDEVVWYINDLVLNLERLPAGPRGLFFRALGYREGLAVNRLGGRWLLVDDRAALTRWLVAELERLPPTVLLTGHGPPIRDPARLAGLAGLLAREMP